jgi:DtxR family transcriptional regulator, Mn-dependent transcriptional regulator
MPERRTLLGEAAEDCLRAVFDIQSAGTRVATSALAARLGVTEPTVTVMVKRLARLGLLQHIPYRGVQLTPAGEKTALAITRQHRLLELYLVEVLGLSWEKVHAEADRMEHSISTEVEDRMAEALGFPTTDPHGHPIPTKEGEIQRPAAQRLADLLPGDGGRVLSVPDRDPELLQYLDRLGLVPDSSVRVVEREPFGGALIVQVSGRHHAVGRELAEVVQVEIERGTQP